MPTSLPELTGERIVTAWSLDLPALAAVLVLALLYGAGVRRYNRLERPSAGATSTRAIRWPAGRSWAFVLGGLGSIVVATMSSLGTYDRTLFWPNATQLVLLLSLCPVLLGFGAPLELAGATLPPPAVAWAARSRVLRLLTFPLVSSGLAVVVLFTLFYTPYYELSLRNDSVHELVRLQMLVAGCLFFWPMLSGEALPAWCTYPVRVGFAFADGLLDAIPAIVVMTDHHVIAGSYYAGLHRSWGPSLSWDQTIGGGLMLTLAEVVALPFLVPLVIGWMRSDEANAALLDRALEVRTRALTPADEEVPATSKPWWEIDPGPLAARERPLPPRRRPGQ